MRELRRIVVGYKRSAAGGDALVLGELLARTLGGELIAARAESRRGRSHPGAEQELERELAQALAGSPLEPRSLLLSGQPAAKALLELADGDPQIGLIALGSSARGTIGRVLPGAVTEKLLAGSPCSIAVAPRGYAQGPAMAGGTAADLRVLAVGFDGSPEAAAALALAARVATAADATLRVIAVGSLLPLSPEAVPPTAGPPAAELQSRLHEAVAELPAELRALPIYDRGEVAFTLVEHAEQGIDLMLLGSRGHGPLGAVLLGSTSAAVVAASPCPVVVVPRPALSTEP